MLGVFWEEALERIDDFEAVYEADFDGPPKNPPILTFDINSFADST